MCLKIYLISMLFKFHNPRWNLVYSFLLKTKRVSRKLTLIIYNLECGFFRDRYAQMGVMLIIFYFGGEIFDLKSSCFEGLLFFPQTLIAECQCKQFWGLTFCCLGVALSCWCDDLLLVVIVLRLPVVSRRTDLVEGRRHYHFKRRSAELSWSQVGLLTQSLQRCRSRFACMRAYVNFVCVCVCVCMYVCVWTCIYVYICMWICIGTRMHVNTCVCVCICMFVHRFWVSVAVLQRV